MRDPHERNLVSARTAVSIFNSVGVELFDSAGKWRSAHVRPDFVKAVLDGVPMTRTSKFLEPYKPDPWAPTPDTPSRRTSHWRTTCRCCGWTGYWSPWESVCRPPPCRGPLLLRGRKVITGSLIGGLPQTKEMLDFCGERVIGAEVEIIGVDEVESVWKRVIAGDVSYRFVLDMATMAD